MYVRTTGIQFDSVVLGYAYLYVEVNPIYFSHFLCISQSGRWKMQLMPVVVQCIWLFLYINWTAHHEGTLEGGGIAPYILTSALGWGERSASTHGRFTHRERAPGTHCIGGWVGPIAVLEAVVKRNIPSHWRESNPYHPARSPALFHRVTRLPSTLGAIGKVDTLNCIRVICVTNRCLLSLNIFKKLRRDQTIKFGLQEISGRAVGGMRMVIGSFDAYGAVTIRLSTHRWSINTNTCLRTLFVARGPV
jgi:hypothetical protein